MGLVDDLIHTKPYQKLIGQIMGSAFVVYYGLSLPWTRSVSLNVVITIFWLIGITNAINLLDNMDGLAAGIAAIASCFLTMNFIVSGQPAEALMMAVFAAAPAGFPGLQLESRVDLHGRLRFALHRFLSGERALVNLAGGRSEAFFRSWWCRSWFSSCQSLTQRL